MLIKSSIYLTNCYYRFNSDNFWINDLSTNNIKPPVHMGEYRTSFYYQSHKVILYVFQLIKKQNRKFSFVIRIADRHDILSSNTSIYYCFANKYEFESIEEFTPCAEFYEV